MESYKGFQVCCQNDRDVIDAIYDRDEYNVQRWKTPPPPGGSDDAIVIDIGAHIGAFTRKWYDINPYNRHVCVEQSPELIAQLTSNTRFHSVAAMVINAVCTYFPWNPPPGRKRVTLEDLLEMMGARYIACLKLDCEGFEFNILENAKAETLARCRLILGEYHGPKNETKFRALVERVLPDFYYEADAKLAHFWLYNPYYWWRKECNA